MQLLSCSLRSYPVDIREVHLSHSYREANYIADYLANLGHSFPYGMHIFDSPNQGLSHCLHYDPIGVFVPRLVRFSNNI
ncbi:hypothetical protein LINGRAHAP2_LOCUS12509 [Linum grandiflorum]